MRSCLGIFSVFSGCRCCGYYVAALMSNKVLNKPNLAVSLKILVTYLYHWSRVNSYFNLFYLSSLWASCQVQLTCLVPQVHAIPDVVRPVAGFEDSIRKFVCHVVGITYQHIRFVRWNKSLLKSSLTGRGPIFSENNWPRKLIFEEKARPIK